jgi:inosine-uridine nucleoside N-ribohydrolase
MGSRYGLRAGRMDKDVMENERKITGGWIYTGYFQWVTNADRSADVNYDPMQPWNQFYENNYTSQFGGETALKPDGTPTYPYAFYPAQRDGTKAHADARGIDNAVDFIIDTINSNPPHTVSILAIGPLTNVALALRKDPSIAERAKEIVYMGGSFYMKGNATNAAEFNWWADPESAKMCVRTPWGDKTSPEFAHYGNQVISGLEVHINLKPIPTSADSTLPPTGTNYSREQESWFDQSQWFYDRIQTEIYSNIRRLPTAAVWDVIAAGWLIDPAATTRWYNSGSENPVTSNSAMAGVKVDVDTNYTENYGRSLPFFDNNGSQTGPAGTQKAAIQADIDQVKFWNDIVAPALIDPSKTVPTPADDYDP